MDALGAGAFGFTLGNDLLDSPRLPIVPPARATLDCQQLLPAASVCRTSRPCYPVAQTSCSDSSPNLAAVQSFSFHGESSKSLPYFAGPFFNPFRLSNDKYSRSITSGSYFVHDSVTLIVRTLRSKLSLCWSCHVATYPVPFHSRCGICTGDFTIRQAITWYRLFSGSNS